MKIQVTKKHIEEAQKVSTTLCPVALALRDVGYRRPLVRRFKIQTGLSLWKKVISSPEIVSKFIRNYDNDLPVEPFEFEMPYNPTRYFL